MDSTTSIQGRVGTPLSPALKGAQVRLIHVASNARIPQIFTLEHKKDGTVALALREKTSAHLRITPRRQVDLEGGLGRWAQFELLDFATGQPWTGWNNHQETCSSCTGFALRNLGHGDATATVAFLGSAPGFSRAEFSCVSVPEEWNFEIVSDVELEAIPLCPPATQAGPLPKLFPQVLVDHGIKEGMRLRLALASLPETPAVEPFVLQHGSGDMIRTFATRRGLKESPQTCPVQFSLARGGPGRTVKGAKRNGGHLRIFRTPAPVTEPTQAAPTDAAMATTADPDDVVKEDKTIDLKGAHGAFAHFDLVPLPTTSTGGPSTSPVFSLRCLAFDQQTEPTFLGISLGSLTELGKPIFVVSKEPVPLVMVPLAVDYLDPTEPKVDPTFTLTNSQRDEFSTQGFLILKKVIPLPLVEDARRVVNHHLGKGPKAWTIDPEDGSYKLPSNSHPAITNLVEQSQVWTALQHMFGPDRIDRPNGGQQAIRFPVVDTFESGVDRVPTTGDTRYHIDGMKNTQLIPFNVLLKVPLSDQSTENNGNITIFPGSHRNPDLLRWYNTHVQAAKDGAYPPNPLPLKPNVGHPHQVCMVPGDVAIIHPHLAHCVGRNSSPNIRYSIIFRMQHVDKPQHSTRTVVSDLIQDPIVGIQMLPDWDMSLAATYTQEEAPVVGTV